MDLISIHNDGPDIVSTDYWGTPQAAEGYFYLSINAGAFRLLVPDSRAGEIREWASAREVIVSRGPWPQAGRADALELLFEDGSEAPYSIHMGAEQIDRMPLATDADRAGDLPRWTFSAWAPAGRALALPCRYRIVKRLPCLRAWTGTEEA